MLETMKKCIENKKVLILGYGREGKSTYKLLQKVKGYENLAIADLNPVTEPLDENVTLVTGENYQGILNEYDVVFKSPGIVLEKEVADYSCEIVSQTEVFFRRFRDQIIGITGTKGKSTTTTLLYHVLKEAGVKCVLAGNIGIPAFDIVEQIEEDTVICFEMSSHQLEYMSVSPRVGVLMNIHEEHLDHYGVMEKYVAAKEKIYRNQKFNDTLICNVDVLPGKENCKARVISVGYENSGADITIKEKEIQYKGKTFSLPVSEIKMIGIHNYYDIGVVYALVQEYQVSDNVFYEALKTYEPLPHRLQYIGTVDGIKYYDDSISTICDTTIQALTSLKDADTVLIGGMDRGIDYEELILFLSDHKIPNIILMEATGKRIYEEIKENYPKFQSVERIKVVENLEQAVNLAKQVTKKEKACLMSPAAASYGIFKNFEERGEVFRKLVNETQR